MFRDSPHPIPPKLCRLLGFYLKKKKRETAQTNNLKKIKYAEKLEFGKNYKIKKRMQRFVY